MAKELKWVATNYPILERGYHYGFDAATGEKVCSIFPMDGGCAELRMDATLGYVTYIDVETAKKVAVAKYNRLCAESARRPWWRRLFS